MRGQESPQASMFSYVSLDARVPADHPLRRLPNLIGTSHIGYVTRDAYAIYYRDVVEDIARWLDGTPVRVLN